MSVYKEILQIYRDHGGSDDPEKEEKEIILVGIRGDASMSPLWVKDMPIEKVVNDILDYLNLRYQGSLINNDIFELKELTREPIGYSAGRIGGDIDAAIEEGLHDQNIDPLPEAGMMENQCDSDCHQKVYQTGTTNGLIHRWICSVCGLRGSDPAEFKTSEYDQLVEKFHGKS